MSGPPGMGFTSTGHAGGAAAAGAVGGAAAAGLLGSACGGCAIDRAASAGTTIGPELSAAVGFASTGRAGWAGACRAAGCEAAAVGFFGDACGGGAAVTVFFGGAGGGATATGAR